jgi:hypothetical protein
MGRIFVFAGILVFLSIIPFEFIEGGPTICVFKNLLGIECPGCGMTRAFSRILRGDLIAAVSYNSLVVIVFPIFCLVLLRDILFIFSELNKSPHSGDLSRRSCDSIEGAKAEGRNPVSCLPIT